MVLNSATPSHKSTAQKLTFLGFFLTGGKVIPREDRLKAFDSMPIPVNKDQLRSALCTLRHNGLFCKGFSQIARCLDSLLRKDERWSWSSIHVDAFNRLRAEISKGTLFCYDLTKPLFITSDASKDGVGHVLSHDAETETDSLARKSGAFSRRGKLQQHRARSSSHG